MRIFDNILLGQYLDVGAKVKVYANSEWYRLSDKRDVSDKIDIVAYDEWGDSHRFNYQTIEQIQVNGQIITLDMISKKLGDKVPDKEDKPEKYPDDKSDDSVPDLAGLEEPEEKKDSKGPDLSWFSPVYDIGRLLIKEKQERKKKSGNEI